MQFILIAHDKAGALPLRMATRPAHLAYWEQAVDAKLLFGGPMLDEAGNPKGSLMIIEAASEEIARRHIAADPYVTAGLFADTALSGFRQVFANGKQL